MLLVTRSQVIFFLFFVIFGTFYKVNFDYGSSASIPKKKISVIEHSCLYFVSLQLCMTGKRDREADVLKN